MDEIGNSFERPRAPLKVREVLARLRDADPDFLVVIDASSQSLIIVNPRPGFCSPAELEEDETNCLAEQDQQFLRDFHIRS
jgi:hypothetical protein